jgi:putative flippase GtrA
VSAPRYAALALGLFAANVALLKLLTLIVGSVILAKTITEASLFVVSYLVQKYVVFTASAARVPARVSTPAVPLGAVATTIRGGEPALADEPTPDPGGG